MPTINLFARSVTSALFETEFIHRKLSLGGALHRLASRQRLRDCLDTYKNAPLSLPKAAVTGAWTLQTLLLPVTSAVTAITGTGITHYSADEFPPIKEGQTRLSYELTCLKAEMVQMHYPDHEARVKLLGNRFDQFLEDPYSMGFLGVTVGAASLPMLFACSAVTSGVGIAIGSIAWTVQRLSGEKADFTETVNDVGSWFCGAPTLLTRSLIPSMSTSFHIATGLGVATLNLTNLTTAYLTLQIARIASATTILLVSAVGALIGVSVGLMILGVQSIPCKDITLPHWNSTSSPKVATP